MTLFELRDFVQQRKVVSLVEIALHFRADEHALEPMLDRWVSKGQMKKIKMDSGSCGSCSACPPGIKIHYEWLGPQSISIVRKA